jgi:sugar lactone lactonase YvrE
MQVHTILKRSIVFLLLMMLVALPTIAQDAELPEMILAERPGFHPEGIEWDAENARFLTGSVTEGTIFEIADDGTVTPFIEDEVLVSSIGIHIDAANRRLLVANSDLASTSDPDATGLAQLGIYDLDTGERLHLVDLGGLLPENKHFANDVTVDEDGNAYVTDSLSPVIYKVTPDGEASIFIEDEQLGAEGFGLNGIEFHAHGFLLAAVGGTASLYKIPLDDPESLTLVEVDQAFGADGIIINSEDGHIFAVAGTVNEDGSFTDEIIEVASEDEWETAEIVNRVPSQAELAPTTVTLRAGVPYVVHAHFNELFSGGSADAFEIIRIDFVEE